MGGEAHRYYLSRDGMQSISPEGGVGGRVLLTRQGRERERERERETERDRERERQREREREGEREREKLLLRMEEWEVVAMVNATG